MNLEQRERAYKMATEKWGILAQMEMAQEEATELALAVRKQIRNNDETSFKNLSEEIADVEIMIEQMKLIHKHSGLSELVESQKEFKINRMIKRIESEK